MKCDSTFPSQWKQQEEEEDNNKKSRARLQLKKHGSNTKKRVCRGAFYFPSFVQVFSFVRVFFSFHTPPNQNTRAGYLCYFFLPRTHRKEQDLRRRRWRWRRHTFVFMFVGFSSRFFFCRDFLQGFSWFSWVFSASFFFAIWRLWIMNESVARGTCNGNMCEKPSWYCCEKCFPKDYYFKISQ